MPLYPVKQGLRDQRSRLKPDELVGGSCYSEAFMLRRFVRVLRQTGVRYVRKK